MKKRKSIGIVFGDRGNSEAIDFTIKSFEYFFGEHATINSHFLNELGEGDMIDDTICAVGARKHLSSILKYVKSVDSVVAIKREVRYKRTSELKYIPSGASVLVVSDSSWAISETIANLVDLGFDKWNYIPCPLGKYESDMGEVHWAITPGEPNLVPEFVENIVDLGYRVIAYSTLRKIGELLEIDEKVLDAKIATKKHESKNRGKGEGRYIHTPISEVPIAAALLDNISSAYNNAILIIGDSGNIVYENQKGKEMFAIDEYQLFEGSPVVNKRVLVKGRVFFVTRFNIQLEGKKCTFMSISNEEALSDEVRNSNRKSTHKPTTSSKHIAKYTFEDIIHLSKVMEECVKLSKRIAHTEHTVLIYGESGTGKELLAQSIHNESMRRKEPFVAVNCSAITESLLESELFGYEAGAFTGANKAGKKGLFEQADGGTIFLDEISDISPHLQASLLRVLQEQQIMRIGSDKVVDINVRVIAATNKNLMELVEKGLFRNDLYYRLDIISIEAPPLRTRKEDIELLFKYFLGRNVIDIKKEEMQAFTEYNWPGNVRELENVCTYFLTLHRFPEKYKEVLARKPEEEKVLVDKSFKSPENLILEYLLKQERMGLGGGRPGMLSYLKENGIWYSDARLRTLLSEMKEKDYIVIPKGRGGTRLTEKGKVAAIERE